MPVEATGKTEEEVADGERAVEDPNRGRGEPEEVEEVDGGFRPLTGSCTCVVPVRQPLEVGENEDCSQAVSAGTPGICSCGSESRKDKNQKEDSVTAQTVGDKSFGNGDSVLLSKSGTATAPLDSFFFPLTRSSYSPPCTPFPQLGPQPCQDQTGIKPSSPDSLLLGQELDGLTIPKTTSPSAGDLLEPPVDLSLEQGRGDPCSDSGGSTPSSAEAQLECTPESLHSQPTEPNLTSGWSKFDKMPILYQKALIGCQVNSVLFVCEGTLPLYCHRVSSVHSIPQFSRSEFAVQATGKNTIPSSLVLLSVRKENIYVSWRLIFLS